MNTNKNAKPLPCRTKIVVRLWCIMMLLVLLSVAFMWVAQIFLFEQNYVDSAITEVQTRLEPVMEDLKTEDLAYNDKLIPYLSKSASCKMILIGGKGELIALYSYGYPIDLEVAETESMVWSNIKRSEEFGQVLRGEQYKKIIQDGSRMIAFEIGIPVMYDNGKAYVVLYHSLTELNTVLDINRNQLIALSVILTLAAAVLAYVLSRKFIKPIHVIKNTVDSLASGDLEATPGLHLKDELGQLSDSVEELGQALKRLDVLRKEVIANVSHELRSPLALITGYAEMVRDVSWKDDTRRDDNLNLIIHEAGRMSEMVDDIMDYSQLQAGYIQLKKDWYNLYEIVESEVVHCEQSAAEHQIRIRLESPQDDISIRIDALKISQVIRNLLYNAINHTAGGETITVAIEKGGNGCRVSVSNPGEAIPEEDRGVIWERYQRGQHHGGRRQGTGIGLSIVSTILKAHGMPYGVDCKDGLTIFWFACPEELMEQVH